ncbi:tRNA dihydrouridine synthase [Bacteroidota bacterium]
MVNFKKPLFSINFASIMNFWKDINKPIFSLSPMEDVTDTVFREIILSVSNPELLHILFSEFTSVDAIAYNPEFNLNNRLKINNSELQLVNQTGTKLVAQIWGSDPEKFRESARLIEKYAAFNGIDINMGCPVKKVVKNRTCSALILFPELAREIIEATKEGTNLPVSIKTRIGFNEPITEKWIGNLLETKPAAITVHGRIQKMMSNGSADWNEIKKAVDLRNKMKSETLILGNGDVYDIQSAYDKINQFRVDGIMVGRGIFMDPFLFNDKNFPRTRVNKFNLMINHINLFRSTWGDIKNPAILKKFFKVYINNFPGASALRQQLMETNTYKEMDDLINSIEFNQTISSILAARIKSFSDSPSIA